MLVDSRRSYPTPITSLLELFRYGTPQSLPLSEGKRKPSIAGGLSTVSGNSSRRDWLPESDAPQNGKGLLFEFSFNHMNAAKGEKRLLSPESIFTASNITITRPKSWSTKDRLELAEACRQKLDACPAITRKGLASQLGMTTTRLNQILSLLKLAPEIRREILTMEPDERVRLSDRALLRLLDFDDPAVQTRKFQQVLKASGSASSGNRRATDPRSTHVTIR